jgi:hypothetical protein
MDHEQETRRPHVAGQAPGLEAILQQRHCVELRDVLRLHLSETWRLVHMLATQQSGGLPERPRYAGDGQDD